MPNDLHNEIKCSRALAPVVVTDGTPQVSTILDTALFGSNELVVVLGALADLDATWVVLLEEGDNSGLSDAAAVADADLLGVEGAPSFIFSDDNKTYKLGYKGKKRYLRATIDDVTTNTGNAPMAAIWVQSHPRSGPQSAQLV